MFKNELLYSSKKKKKRRRAIIKYAKLSLELTLLERALTFPVILIF